jgi:glycosyltransferase involved in cell wall biosynthesis
MPPETRSLLVSIVVATFDRPQALGNALRSISLQTYSRFEVIVVNDGGVDVSDIVTQWRPHMPIQYVHLPANGGLAHARNVGVRHASGDIVCFLDDDDTMLAEHLQVGVRALVEGDAEAAYVHVAVCDEFVAPGTAPTASQVRAYYKAAFDPRLLFICNFMPVNAVFIRKRSDVPLVFDENLRHLEDWDLWLRLHVRSGYRFRAVPVATTVYHRVPGFSSMTSRVFASAEEALRFRETFRLIASRYPSDERVVAIGRSLHDDFYAALANASVSANPALAFAYERFVECMEAFVNGRIDATAARQRIGIE